MKATNYGVIQGLNLACCIDENGRRHILAKDAAAALGLQKKRLGARELAAFFGTKNVKPFVGAELWERLNSPTDLDLPASAHGARRGVGFDPRVVIDGAKAVLAARRGGKIGARHEAIATACEALIETLAGVGLDALIDDACGVTRASGSLNADFLKKLVDRVEVLEKANESKDQTIEKLSTANANILSSGASIMGTVGGLMRWHPEVRAHIEEAQRKLREEEKQNAPLPLLDRAKNDGKAA